MNIQDGIAAVIEKHDLDHNQMTDIMRQIMTGEATESQIGGFLVGLRMKGETVTEVAAAANVMRGLASTVSIRSAHLLDTCGTGGDASDTFNISTASAFVAAAAGAKVAKHGNRSVSSKSGSADVLEAAGVNLALTPREVARCIETVGVGFLFAPQHHSAMKYAIGPRREMATRTIFNLLGPLTNPAGAPNQVLGVFSKDWVEPLAKVLQKLGSEHVMVVSAEDGLDEISLSSATFVAELKEGKINCYSITPEDFGFDRASISEIKVNTPEESLAMIKAALNNQHTAARDIVALNAGAGIYTAGLTASLHDGIKRALQALTDGSASSKLEQLVEFTQWMKV